MTLSPIDHAIAVVLLVVFPLLGKRNFRRFRESIENGGPDARREQYVKIIARQWVLAAAVVGWWLAAGRTLAALGLVVPPGPGTLAGAGITATVLAFLARQVQTVRGLTLDELVALAPKLGGLSTLLPRTGREAATFRLVAVTAGVCEEVIYRGFLIAYLASWVPIWPAAVIGGVAFGIAHAYQGASGVLKTGATGLVAGFLYVGTGSLLWPMLIHAGIDLHGGAIGRRVVEARTRVPPAPAPSEDREEPPEH